MSAGDFWSRRKAAVAAEADAELAAIEAEQVAEAHAELEERPDAEILEELGLKDPDTLESGDDFSAYLKAAVPERLRRRALRRLWLSDPVFANLDGMVDYGEDFTDSAMAVEAIQTAYQVGKGMLKHVEALAEKEAADGLDADVEVEPEDPVPLAHSEPLPMAETAETPNVYVAEELDEADPEPVDELPPPRRMRFEFT